jgi:hypothetical protein
LILDINGNLTEAREDNNHALVELVVVEPYAAQIDIPNQIPRINPGTTETITVSMLATGSRTESWTLSWDDSNLPNDWSIVADSNQNLNPTLIPGIAQQFVFIASIPGSALGDDNSFVALTLTLDSNTEIEFNSILPIEVLRTRGLSIVGPSGLDSTEGYGRPGDIATAWMMVENLGNAYETTTSIDWTAPSWGGTPTLHDNSGTEVFSLNLAPGEVVELLVNLNTPINVQLGSVTATTMTMCIGSGQETLCEDLFVNLTAASVTVESIHQRTLPNQTLEWSVEGLIPSDGVMSWNIGSANMIHSNWVWTVSGDLSFDGSNIGASGNPDEPFSGNIYLQLPVNAIPQRHYFTTNSQSDDYHGLYFTLHVLQVYRSSATIVQPVPNNLGEPVSMFVEITNQVLLRLENPGNGQDDFLLSTEVIAGPEMTSPPVVTVVEYNPQRTLGPLASTIATVDITLSEDTPAQEPFMLRFKWQSLEGENVESIVDLLIEAEPDHSWDLDFAGGLNYNILPSETLNLNFTVKNTGNALDNILIKPDFELNYFENDVSIWSSLNKSYDDIAVNQTVSIDLSVIAPSNTWSGTTATLRLDLYSDDLYVSNVSLTLNVIQISGWRLNLSDTNLIIAPGGQNLTLNVEHLGNLARQPWYSKAGEGWNITVPQNGNTVQPYDDTTVTIFVTPPSNSVAGEVGVLRLRVSDGDGSGQTIQEVPVRVGSSPSIDLYSKGDWLVNNSQESMPTTWIENTGNDLAILNLNVIGVPNDWTVNYPETMVVSPGQVIGLPIGLLPSTTWDGSTISIDIAVTHPVLGTQSITMNLKQSDFAFTSSPVISGVVGELATISTTNDEVSVTNDISLSDSTLVVMIPNTKQNITLNSLDGIDEYYIHSAGYTLPEYTASCSFISSSMSELGMMILSDKIGSCSLTAAQDTRFSGSVVVLTNAGENVPLERSQFSIAQDQSSTFDINTSNWKPEAGSLTLTLLVVDSYGREIVVETTEVISRSDGWNIGISEMTAEENIRIALTRTSYQRLVGVTCTIILDSPDNPWTQSIIVDIGGIDYAPTIEIKDPGVFSSNDEIRAEFRCTSPYDIDDNPDDDTAEAFYQPPKSEIIESSQVIFSLFTIVIILGGAYFAGLLTANKPRNTKPAKSNEEPIITETTEQDDKIEDIVEEDIDDFSLEIEQDSNEDIMEIIDLDESESTISQSIDDSSASGRLASLRDEIMTDDKPVDTRPISDRMADFFND